jgi:hypothetical protein
MIKFTITPHPRTNINDGFHSFPKPKKPIMFDLLTIPATNNPEPNIIPTMKVMI